MFFKSWAKWGYKLSEEEINNFLEIFLNGTNEQNGQILARVALLHYSFNKSDPLFVKLSNSKVGENIKEISKYILFLNSMHKEYNKKGDAESSAALRFINVCFRCMSNPAFNRYGMKLWEKAKDSFCFSKEKILNDLNEAKNQNMENLIIVFEGALSIYNYIPPQFDIAN
jgi:hypothetical protein